MNCALTPKALRLPYEALLEEVASRALVDSEFASALRDDPKRAVESIVGYDIADGVSIEVHTNRFEVKSNGPDGVLHLVVPVDPRDVSDGERSCVPLCMRFRAADHYCHEEHPVVAQPLSQEEIDRLRAEFPDLKPAGSKQNQKT